MLYCTLPYHTILHYTVVFCFCTFPMWYMYIYTYFSIYSICKHIHNSFPLFYTIWIMDRIIANYGAWILRFRVKIRMVCKTQKTKIQHFLWSLDLRRQKRSPSAPRVLDLNWWILGPRCYCTYIWRLPPLPPTSGLSVLLGCWEARGRAAWNPLWHSTVAPIRR